MISQTANTEETQKIMNRIKDLGGTLARIFAIDGLLIALTTISGYMILAYLGLFEQIDINKNFWLIGAIALTITNMVFIFRRDKYRTKIDELITLFENLDAKAPLLPPDAVIQTDEGRNRFVFLIVLYPLYIPYALVDNTAIMLKIRKIALKFQEKRE